jgi:hypothetical protein
MRRWNFSEHSLNIHSTFTQHSVNIGRLVMECELVGASLPGVEVVLMRNTALDIQ